MSEKAKITISSVLECLNDGMTRKEIAEKFGITATECKILFQHEKLKGKKTRKPISFVIVDDVESEDDTQSTSADLDDDGVDVVVALDDDDDDEGKTVWSDNSQVV